LLVCLFLYYKFNSNVSATAAYYPPFFASPSFNWAGYNVQVGRVAVSYKF